MYISNFELMLSLFICYSNPVLGKSLDVFLCKETNGDRQTDGQTEKDRDWVRERQRETRDRQR